MIPFFFAKTKYKGHALSEERKLSLQLSYFHIKLAYSEPASRLEVGNRQPSLQTAWEPTTGLQL